MALAVLSCLRQEYASLFSSQLPYEDSVRPGEGINRSAEGEDLNYRGGGKQATDFFLETSVFCLFSFFCFVLFSLQSQRAQLMDIVCPRDFHRNQRAGYIAFSVVSCAQ